MLLLFLFFCYYKTLGNDSMFQCVAFEEKTKMKTKFYTNNNNNNKKT